MICILQLTIGAFSGAMLRAEHLHLASGTLMLHEAWTIQSSAKVAAEGEVLSLPGCATTDWYPARVPSTVFGTLVKAGVYQDVFFAT